MTNDTQDSTDKAANGRGPKTAKAGPHRAAEPPSTPTPARTAEPTSTAPPAKAGQHTEDDARLIRCKVCHGIYWVSSVEQHPVGALVTLSAAEAAPLIKDGILQRVKA